MMIKTPVFFTTHTPLHRQNFQMKATHEAISNHSQTITSASTPLPTLHQEKQWQQVHYI